MLSALHTTIAQTECHLGRFMDAVASRTTLTRDQLVVLWYSTAAYPPQPDPQPVSLVPPAITPVAVAPIPVITPVAAAPVQTILPVVVAAPVQPVSAPVAAAPVRQEEEEFPEVGNDDMEEDEPLRSNKCRHIMVAGKSKGKPCGANVKENGYCSKHKKSTPAAPVKVDAKAKSPPKEEKEDVEFVKFTSREEEKRVEFRVKTREYLLNHKTYPPVETEVQHGFLLVKSTRVILNEQKNAVLGYLSEQNALVRQPNTATDKVVLDYGIPFDTSHISESDIDE